jgi:NADH-quinone oxidoreductase subunit J
VLNSEHWGSTNSVPAGAADQTRALGESLIGPYAVPFEVASLLLLAALVGAIVLAKSEREPEPEVPPLAIPEEAIEELVTV